MYGNSLKTFTYCRARCILETRAQLLLKGVFALVVLLHLCYMPTCSHFFIVLFYPPVLACSTETPDKRINQFPFENVITIKVSLFILFTTGLILKYLLLLLYLFFIIVFKTRGGHAQLFFESAIAISQLEGSTSAIAIPQLFKEMLLRNRNYAIPQLQFFLMSAT
jgi:hypothetical protein